MALPPEKLAEMMPSLLRVFGSHEAALVEFIATLGELSGVATDELDEGEELIARGCALIRQAIQCGAPQDPSST